jgi:predicted MFS family arabinose efflux permease
MPQLSERRVIFLIGAVQFINILDFVMVMPLGPDFARALHVPSSKLGMIGGSYTAAAALSGLLGSFFLDRFDRRRALAVAMLGLVLGTAAGGIASGLRSLMLARVLAGLFGGPATSVSLSIIADVIPVERRGKAMGAVMGAFSLAQVLGVPAGLKLAELGGWRVPFFGVAGLGLLVTLGSILLLPPLRMHLAERPATTGPSLITLVRRPLVLLSYAMTATVMLAGFIVIPNIAAYVQHNLRYPRSHLDILYFSGGVASFFTLRIVGRLIDRYGSFRVGTAGSLMAVTVLYFGFYLPSPPMPVVALFVGFMLALSTRNVAYNALTTKVPRPAERAQFMSIQSMVQHAASASGAFLSSQLLRERSDMALIGMPTIALISIGLTLLLPLFLYAVELGVNAARATAPG